MINSIFGFLFGLAVAFFLGAELLKDANEAITLEFERFGYAVVDMAYEDCASLSQSECRDLFRVSFEHAVEEDED